jgi:hypothetical protein
MDLEQIGPVSHKLYLDDGFGFAENNELCYEHAQVVKNEIVRSGLVPNKDKSIWNPKHQFSYAILFVINVQIAIPV